MALLINKLFSSRKKQYNKHQDACDRQFNFSQEQVRLVLFRECDFRGRKLLFDSQSVQKIQMPLSACKQNNGLNKNEIFVEVSNGYGYQYSRPNNDIIQLGEMIFGSVAMSFRGTSLKIHSFSSPAKLMCTQVFPSPRHPIRGRVSVTSQNFDTLRSNSSVQSFEKSIKLDYSSASSTTSFNEQISLCSTESDIKNITPSDSVPLDVPTNNQSMTGPKLAPSLEGDSGFCGEQSYSSVSSGPPSISLWDTRHETGSVHGFSCGSLYKRWLRSASTSLDYNQCSDSSLATGSNGGCVHSSASADECITRPQHRSSKLGLAVIIILSQGQEIDLERFLLEHSALIEAMVCRARFGAESAYTKPGNFASMMYQVFRESSDWLTDLIAGPRIGNYLWHTLNPRIQSSPGRSSSSFNCDNDIISKTQSESNLLTKNKLSSECTDDNRTRKNYLLSAASLIQLDDNGYRRRSNCFRNDLCDKCDVKLSVNSSFITHTSLNAERFVRELCELLEAVDTKHTNFFISTLLTAVLTHHLGWVSTVLPASETDKETISKLHSPCNPLWGQLSDLYGAVGCPTKLAQTIICGSTKSEIITKILYTLTYFIRCSIVERNFLFKYCSHEESPDAVTDSNSVKNNNKPIERDKIEELEMSNLSETKTSTGLVRTKSCLGTINQASDEITKYPLLEKVTNLGLSAAPSNDFQLIDSSDPNLVDIKEASDQVHKIFHSKLRTTDSCSNLTKPVDESNVIFVLGDNEKLIGLKKKNIDEESLNIPSCSNKRPTDLKIPTKLFHCIDSSDDSSSPDLTPSSCRHISTDTSPCSNRPITQLLPSTSTLNNNELINKIVLTRSSVINLETESNDMEKTTEVRRRGDEFNRSQSVPPSDKSQKKCSKSGCKKKYAGVKFDFKQYPQIVTNYMKSKNLEMSQLPFTDKSLQLNRSFSTSLYDCSKFDPPSCDCEPHSQETLQTPSNASELESTSELINREKESCNQLSDSSKVNEEIDHPLKQATKAFTLENNALFEHDIDTYEENICDKNTSKMSFIELPMPRINYPNEKSSQEHVGYTETLLRGLNEKYTSNMVLQGTISPPKCWEHLLKRDLTLAARKPLLDQPIQEAVAIVANTDTWDVQLVSSHTYVVEKGSMGVQIGMSQLIANMLESLLHMWKLRTPPEYCLMHIEARLRELCLRSKVLAQLLMTTDFCNMNLLTTTMQLEVNDVPLLMAVASTHTPQVTQKYGLSFQ